MKQEIKIVLLLLFGVCCLLLAVNQIGCGKGVVPSTTTTTSTTSSTSSTSSTSLTTSTLGTTSTTSSTSSTSTSTTTSTTTTTIQAETPLITFNTSPVIGISYEVASLEVTLTSTTDSASIYYTTNGATPSASSTLYSTPFWISTSSTISAIAVKTGFSNSGVASKTADIYWWSAAGTLNATVETLFFDGSTLYAGGWFTPADGCTGTRIAKLQNGAWASVLSTPNAGPNNTVYSVAYGATNYVYLGGAFTLADGESLNHLGNFFSGSFQGSYNGVNDTVYAVSKLSTNNITYFGGKFTASGSSDFIPALPLNSIGSVTGGQGWSSMANGVDRMSGTPNVFALTADTTNNILYVGGDFDTVSGEAISAANIASWNATSNSWSAMPGIYTEGGAPASVKAIAMFDTVVYIGGDFGSFKNISKWGGSSWLEVDASGTNATVEALAYDSTSEALYVGGQFTQAGGQSHNYFAKYTNDGGFASMGTGFNGPVYSIAVDSNGDVYVGGNFSSASGVAASNIAKWGKK